jgi:hypothetical protein
MVADAIRRRASDRAPHSVGRVATAKDIAGPIVFLCSEHARHITGEISERERRQRPVRLIARRGALGAAGSAVGVRWSRVTPAQLPLLEAVPAEFVRGADLIGNPYASTHPCCSARQRQSQANSIDARLAAAFDRHGAHEVRAPDRRRCAGYRRPIRDARGAAELMRRITLMRGTIRSRVIDGASARLANATTSP